MICFKFEKTFPPFSFPGNVLTPSAQEPDGSEGVQLQLGYRYQISQIKSCGVRAHTLVIDQPSFFLIAGDSGATRVVRMPRGVR